jgi:hydroxyacylglutathione hydrolase
MYYDQRGWLFCGDVLFSLGCGRCFECEYEVMWRSLARIIELPDTTQLFCGHEYTLSNARFALAVDPDNAALHARVKEAQSRRCTLPVLLGAEKATNPFLKVATPQGRESLGFAPGVSASEAFAELRRRKDHF